MNFEFLKYSKSLEVVVSNQIHSCPIGKTRQLGMCLVALIEASRILGRVAPHCLQWFTFPLPSVCAAALRRLIAAEFQDALPVQVLLRLQGPCSRHEEEGKRKWEMAPVSVKKSFSRIIQCLFHWMHIISLCGGSIV